MNAEEVQHLDGIIQQYREVVKSLAALTNTLALYVGPPPMVHVIAGSQSEAMTWARRTRMQGLQRCVTAIEDLETVAAGDVVYALRSARVTREEAVKYWEHLEGVEWIQVGVEEQ